MNLPRTDCDRTRSGLPELALGIADGEERAAALSHLAGCPDCRHELERLSSTADDLLDLAPRREPPAGFEGRVLAQLGVHEEARVRWWRARPRVKRLSFAAAVLASVAATVIGMNLAYSSDRHLASQYRAALQGAHGKYFQSAHLRAPDGSQAGIVFGYQGSPSWLFYVLDGRYSDGLYREQIVTRSGHAVTLPSFRLAARTWGIATPVPLRDIALVRLIREPSGAALEAPLPPVER
jgi:hypothetical protein